MVTFQRLGWRGLAVVVAVLELGLVASGCGTAAHPTSPGGLRSPTPVRVTLSGSVYEHTFAGQLPLRGVGVHLTLAGNPPPDDMRDAVSDGNGRYLIQNVLLPYSETWQVSISGETHQLPCGPALGSYGITGATVDVHAVPAAALSVGGVPPTHPQSGAYGTVSEVVGTTNVPVADAQVRLFTEDELLDTIMTDADGRFGFCLVYDSAYGRRSWPFWVTVVKAGYEPSGFVVVQSAFLRKVDLRLVPDTTRSTRSASWSVALPPPPIEQESRAERSEPGGHDGDRPGRLLEPLVVLGDVVEREPGVDHAGVVETAALATVAQGSDADGKDQIEPVEPKRVLARCGQVGERFQHGKRREHEQQEPG